MADGMVDIKKKSSEGSELSIDEGSGYPYGTCLSFEDDMVDELGAGSLKPGDVVEVRGYAYVERKSEYADKEDSGKSISMQLTSVKVTPKAADKAEQMYGE